jgi:UV DNA damage endonuclease
MTKKPPSSFDIRHSTFGIPELGLVCLSSDGECAFRTTTLKRYRSLPCEEAQALLRSLYWDNVQRLHWTLGYCARRGIRLYRATSGLFPMSDEPDGEAILREMAATLSGIGRRAKRLGIRVVLHPDQFVVLNSEREQTCRTSALILEKHALAFDLMGLPRSPWSLMNIHGGKAGRSDELVAAIKAMPRSVRSRITLENDEYSYGADEILDACRRAGVPMVFDCHHHVIKEGLDSYDHPSIAKHVKLARATWPKPEWQLCHVSNGETAFRDRYHSERITMMPKAFAKVPWIEVEARGKEQAIAALREQWPTRAGPADGFPLRKATAAEQRDAAAAAEPAGE